MNTFREGKFPLFFICTHQIGSNNPESGIKIKYLWGLKPITWHDYLRASSDLCFYFPSIINNDALFDVTFYRYLRIWGKPVSRKIECDARCDPRHENLSFSSLGFYRQSIFALTRMSWFEWSKKAEKRFRTDSWWNFYRRKLILLSKRGEQISRVNWLGIQGQTKQ